MFISRQVFAFIEVILCTMCVCLNPNPTNINKGFLSDKWINMWI